jgi:hypothetical protein
MRIEEIKVYTIVFGLIDPWRNQNNAINHKIIGFVLA